MRNENANTHTHEQKSDGKTVSGSYRVDLPDGRIQVVSYIADEKGYRAVVRYENTLDLSKYYPSESVASTEPPRYQSETSPEPQVYEKKEPSITLPASNYKYKTEEIHRAPTSEREYVNNQPPARETYSEPNVNVWIVVVVFHQQLFERSDKAQGGVSRGCPRTTSKEASRACTSTS